MNQCKPCGGVFLQGACRAIAIADFLSTIFAMIFTTVGSVQAAKEFEKQFSSNGNNNSWNSEMKMFYKKWLIILTTAYFVQYVIFFLMSATLFIGAVERCRKKCNMYVATWCVLIAIDLGLLVTHEIKISASPFVCVAFACFHAYKIYSLWVVWAFIQEMRSYGDYNDLLRNLNDEEIFGFDRGDPNCNFVPGFPIGNEAIGAQPFNRDYEIAEEKLFINNEAVLGSGAYGRVLKGKLLQPNGDKIDVAVKTTKPEAAGVSYFKALLLELKIMIHVGPHLNIVNLFGAVTKNIRSRQLWIVVEFCPNGNLEGYLRKNRENYRDFVKDDEIISFESQNQETEVEQSPSNYENINRFSTEDLLVWSVQIAKGMQYLAEKQVIHGDLATRNILLMMDKTVKITDFGLSRKMYNYAHYVTKEPAPLPWRYMAVESLKDMKFSTMSDVWAYGVTLWEMFSLGGVPFSGLSWTADFVERLVDGARLSKPRRATSELYKIMMDCWQTDPDHRPDFEDLRDQFNSILARINPIVSEFYQSHGYADTGQKYCYYDG